MSSDETAWADRLDAPLVPFVSALRRQAQRRCAPVYVRGLLLPGEGKSVDRSAQAVSSEDIAPTRHRPG